MKISVTETIHLKVNTSVTKMMRCSSDNRALEEARAVCLTRVQLRLDSKKKEMKQAISLNSMMILKRKRN